MGLPATQQTEHRITVDAAADVVFDLIADVGNWPRIFPPSVHVEHVEGDGHSERIRIWATANGEVKGWTSRRELDRDRLRIRFRQEVSQSPVAAMGGEWLVEPLPDGQSLIRLKHDFRAVGDDPEKVAWIQQAVDRNSAAELAALRAAAQHTDTELVLSFDDTVRVAGPAKDVYDFLYEANRWSQRLPHVARVAVDEDSPQVQLLEMDTRSGDGCVHTTRSVRICFPHDRIVYKQLQPPALLSVHLGQWLIREGAGDTVVTARHTVVINPEPIARILGQQAGVAEARAFVRTALGRNSISTLQHAKAHAEATPRT